MTTILSSGLHPENGSRWILGGGGGHTPNFQDLGGAVSNAILYIIV